MVTDHCLENEGELSGHPDCGRERPINLRQRKTKRLASMDQMAMLLMAILMAMCADLMPQKSLNIVRLVRAQFNTYECSTDTSDCADPTYNCYQDTYTGTLVSAVSAYTTDTWTGCDAALSAGFVFEDNNEFVANCQYIFDNEYNSDYYFCVNPYYD
jgi:hypothetical protein